MRTILIIDDYDGFVQSIHANFRHEYNILSADNGKDGLKILKHQQIDLCILDYRLPKMNGDEVLLKIREVKPHLPVIFLTAYPSVELKTKVTSQEYRAGAFLHKPVKPDYLNGFMHDLLSPEKNTSSAELVVFVKGKKSQNTGKKGTIPRKQRLIEMVTLIKEEPKKWTLGRFRVKYRCSRMQIYRDIEEIKKVEPTLTRTKEGYEIVKKQKL